MLFIDLDQEGKSNKSQARTYIMERLLDKLHEPPMGQGQEPKIPFPSCVLITRLQTLAPSCVLSLAQ